MNVPGLVHHLGKFVAPLSSSVSNACRNSSIKYINGLRKGLPWALAISDASAKPQAGLLEGNVDSLGYFDECINIKSQENISAQHCVAVLNLESGNMSSPFEMMLTTRGLHWGMCLPSTCSESEVLTGLNEWMNDWKIHVSKLFCQDSLLSTDAVDWFAMFVLVLLVLCVLLSTGYDAYLTYRYGEARSNKYSIGDYRRSFSILNNGHYLCKDASDRGILCLYGIRALSILWIVFGHVIFVMSGSPAMNYLELSKMKSSWTAMPIISAPLAVDTFLLISGLLVANKFLKSVPRKTSLRNVGLLTVPMFANRYLRIAPAVAVLILLQVSLWRHAGSGPLWVSNNSYLVQFCQWNWLWALLFVQNYVVGNTMCFGHSWYLSVDTQLFLLSPLIITPLLFWRERVCILMLGCIIFSGFLISFSINYLNEFPVGLMTGDPAKWAAKNQYYYVVTHTRFAPYVIGIAVGYLIHKHKDTEMVFPVFKTGRYALLCLLAAATALLYSVYGVLPFQSPDYEYQPFAASVFTAAVPIIWSLGVGWIVLACELKQWPLLSRFLGTPKFHPLSRLTYCIYLVHLPIMSMRASTMRVPEYILPTRMVVDFFGDCGLSIIFGVLLYLGVEAPFVNFGYLVSDSIRAAFGVGQQITTGEGETNGAAARQLPRVLLKEDVSVAGSSSKCSEAGPSTSVVQVVVHSEAGESAEKPIEEENVL